MRLPDYTELVRKVLLENRVSRGLPVSMKEKGLMKTLSQFLHETELFSPSVEDSSFGSWPKSVCSISTLFPWVNSPAVRRKESLSILNTWLPS